MSYLKKPILLSIILLIVSALGSISFAQTTLVNGNVVDDKNETLGFASVVLLNSTDSSQQGFTLSIEDGTYQFKNVKAGSYIIQVFLMGYDLEATTLTTSGEAELTIPPFVLAESSITLKEALIKAKSIPMVFKGDTIVYNPNAFTTKSNATVEDLLKKLPGVQVDKNGVVTAQGEQVVKVLVNGKEFFGNDPTKATQNIDAKSIEKVEVLDKKSDEASFTGVDDGTREKVINLVLKEDANKGYFGKVEAGGGTKETYKVKTVLNYFNKENQYTVIGNLNNLNQNGFSWQEYYRMLNGSDGVNLGQSTYWFQQNDWMGSNSEGRQQNAVLGTNGHFKVGKGEIDASYFAMNRSNDLQTTSRSENYLPTQTIYSNSSFDAIMQNAQHRGNLKYVFKPDTLNSITAKGQIDLTSGDKTDNSFNRNETNEAFLINNSLSQGASIKANFNLKGELIYMRKFKNTKHYLLLNSGAEINNAIDSSKWANQLSSSSLEPNRDLPNQYSDNIGGTGTVFYNKAVVAINVKNDYFISFSVDNKTSFDHFDQQRTYLVFDSLLSGQSPEIEGINSISKAGISFTKNREGAGWYFNAGLNLGKIDVDRTVSQSTDAGFKKSYLFVLPGMYVSYHKPKKLRIGWWFNSSEQFAGMNTLNPTPNIVNPIRTTFGNLELDPYVNYNTGIHGNYRDNKRQIFYYFNNNSGVAPNSVYSVETRSNENVGTMTYKNGKYSAWFNNNVNVQFKLDKLNMSVGVQAGSNYYTNFSELNGITYQNKSNSFDAGLDIDFDFSKPRKMELNFAYDPSYTIQNTGYLSEPNKYMRHEYSTDYSINLTDRFMVAVEYEVYFFNSLNVGSQQVIPLLNAGMEYKLDSNDRWIISVDGFDLLNKNQKIDRNFFGNSFSETRQNTLTRYIMFNLIYSIRKGKKKEERGRQWD